MSKSHSGKNESQFAQVDMGQNTQSQQSPGDEAYQQEMCSFRILHYTPAWKFHW